MTVEQERRNETLRYSRVLKTEQELLHWEAQTGWTVGEISPCPILVTTGHHRAGRPPERSMCCYKCNHYDHGGPRRIYAFDHTYALRRTDDRKRRAFLSMPYGLGGSDREDLVSYCDQWGLVWEILDQPGWHHPTTLSIIVSRPA